MKNFSVSGIENKYVYYNPNPNATTGLALTFWYSNIRDLVFFCELMKREWLHHDKLDISVGSYANLSKEDIERLKPCVNYIVKVEEDHGHFLGTTVNCHGAMHPLMTNESLSIVAHTDSDVPWVGAIPFWGFVKVLEDSGKLILTSQDTYLYDLETMTTSIYEGHDIDQRRQFGSAFFLNRKRALDVGYYPFDLINHFERDRFLTFERLGLSIEEDAIIVKRAPIDIDLPQNFLYSFDFNLFVLHQSGQAEPPETVDRKIRLLQLMYTPAWENMTLGFREHYNPKSPRKY